MALPTLGVLDKDGAPQTINTPNSGRQAATSSQAMVLSTEDKTALDAVATAAKQDAEATLVGAVNETAPATDTASSGLNGRLQRIAQRLTSLIGLFTFTNTRLLVRGEPRAFAVAGTAITRPANTTVYSQNDAISNSATAGSVTAKSFTVSDTNDDPIVLERMRIDSTDTGLGGNMLRAYLYQSDPTASSGIVGGDNATFSTKKGTFLGTMSGTLRDFSDGDCGVLVPDEGSRIIAKPTSGGTTIFYELMTPTGFTPSANSTVITPTLEGFQARA